MRDAMCSLRQDSTVRVSVGSDCVREGTPLSVCVISDCAAIGTDDVCWQDLEHWVMEVMQPVPAWASICALPVPGHLSVPVPVPAWASICACLCLPVERGDGCSTVISGNATCVRLRILSRHTIAGSTLSSVYSNRHPKRLVQSEVTAAIALQQHEACCWCAAATATNMQTYTLCVDDDGVPWPPISITTVPPCATAHAYSGAARLVHSLHIARSSVMVGSLRW